MLTRLLLGRVLHVELYSPGPVVLVKVCICSGISVNLELQYSLLEDGDILMLHTLYIHVVLLQ